MPACPCPSYVKHLGPKLTAINADMQALAKFAFGLGTLQMVLCTLAFTLFALPVGNGIGTQILVKIFHAPSGLAAIRTVDEAVVIGAALSLSSSAFVLQLLSENGELASKFGSATLGILLLQVTGPTWVNSLCQCLMLHMHVAVIAHPRCLKYVNTTVFANTEAKQAMHCNLAVWHTLSACKTHASRNADQPHNH